MPSLERVPADEAERIKHIIELTRAQMAKRYASGTKALRGQHAKQHACVSGTLKVLDDIPEDRRRGVFAVPGREYEIWVRYSNASAIAGADSTPASPGTPGTPGTPPTPASHGSRGMAIKIVGVSGTPLMTTSGSVDQDFLMVNHPVFPFANAEDYEAMSQLLAEDKNPLLFAGRIKKLADGKTPDMSDPATVRARTTLGIIQRVQSLSTPTAFQAPPACPFDNDYFGGAPFLFGPDHVMRVRVTPISPAVSGTINMGDPDYLRKAVTERLTAAGADAVRFAFQVQVRSAEELAPIADTAIEDASQDWPDETAYPFVTVAVIDIPPQDPTTAERVAFGETLSYSPWHGIEDHRPLGGINRLRRAVYEASLAYRQPV